METGSIPIPTTSVLSISFWQYYFDVTTDLVKERVIYSLNPRKAVLAQSFSLQSPDLYGPFWISITFLLVSSILAQIWKWRHVKEDTHSFDPFLIFRSYVCYLLIPLLTSVVFAALFFLGKRTVSNTSSSQPIPSLVNSTLIFLAYFGYTTLCYLIPSLLTLFNSSQLNGISFILATFFSSIVFMMNTKSFFSTIFAKKLYSLLAQLIAFLGRIAMSVGIISFLFQLPPKLKK
ncbi:hypothetical protein BLNAU_10439 [Blattamonas nauphoetae]|uniref:Protein YIPF n=1 Tax=Blattamonas nauphoetae TaxID=2049346 RepID=A0ABQ9XSA4_9EUKA|nr:hypothetical protein BLNAU_10439 [Blattamonas nauphoetae]